MAKLTDVMLAADLTTIDWRGETYYRVADGEEAQVGDLFYVTVHTGEGYVTVGGVYRTCEGEFIDNDGDELPCVNPAHPRRDGIFFRKGPAPSLAEDLSLQLAEARAKVAEIERQIAEETRSKYVGKVAIVRDEGLHADLCVGDLVKITDYDADDEEGIRAELIDGSDYDLFGPAALEIVDEAQARAYLYAEADRELARAFGRPRP